MKVDEPILFYSDFNCPFCYSLNERLITVGGQQRLEWRSIEHMPFADSQQKSSEVQSMLVAEVSVIRKRAPEIQLSTPSFRPSSRPANRLVYTLRDQPSEKLLNLYTLIYRAYWQQNLDIQNEAVLQDLVTEAGLDWPEQTDPGADQHQKKCQAEWESQDFNRRLPALYSVKEDRPMMGFPTYDLLCHFIEGSDLPMIPESLAACELRPRQEILVVSTPDEGRCNTVELEAAYEIYRYHDLETAKKWLDDQSCWPDLIVIDFQACGPAGLDFCRELRLHQLGRRSAIVILLEAVDSAQELAAFDTGASDVMFDLSDAKVCQARLELQLRVKRSSTYLDAMTRLDYLTELPNRREFDRKLEDEWGRHVRSGENLALIMIDIDYFKLYNDNYGHAMGDDCLRQVASAMFACIKRSADMLARYGGEEFVAVLPGTDLAGACEIARKINAAVEALQLPHDHSGVSQFVTVSLGVASNSAEQGQSPTELVRKADEALYSAKNKGRNQFVAFEE